jgi:hypothetical protein
MMPSADVSPTGVLLQVTNNSILIEVNMKTIHELTTISAIALSTFTLIEVSGGSLAYAGPIVPAGRYCMTFDTGGSDCSFTSYSECLATAWGIDAECYGKTARDDNDRQRDGRNSYARAEARR